MNPEELKETCLEQFGAGWQSKLARFLEVNPRTVRRWAAGEWPVPTKVALLLALRKKAKPIK